MLLIEMDWQHVLGQAFNALAMGRSPRAQRVAWASSQSGSSGSLSGAEPSSEDLVSMVKERESGRQVLFLWETQARARVWQRHRLELVRLFGSASAAPIRCQINKTWGWRRSNSATPSLRSTASYTDGAMASCIIDSTSTSSCRRLPRLRKAK